jgi:DNA helicase-2/ATP-dependent DNA helicase PcrA
MAVIDRNPHRTPKRLFTERGEGQRAVIHETYDDREEAAFVVDTIASKVARQGAQPGDFAIMYRTNAQSRLLEEAFLFRNLPYKLVGAQRFYGRREIKDIIAYLRLVHNPEDEVSLLRVINLPARGIGAKTLISLRTYAQKIGLKPGSVLLELGKDGAPPHPAGLGGRAASALADFGVLLAGWRAEAADLPPLSLMDRILEQVDYRAYLDDGTDEGRERWENVMELRRLASEYQNTGLEAFLEALALVSDQDTLENSANVPTLLTLHAAKGLEFRVVFIVGLTDGVLPHIRSFDDPEEMEEERRLFYVGITRAMDQLYLVVPLNRSAYGYSEPVDESRFIQDIPAHLLDSAGRARRRERLPSYYRADRWESLNSATGKVVQPRYHPGARVNHPVWGEGMVLNSRLQDDDEIVDVFFAEVGLKRLAASLARLELRT